MVDRDVAPAPRYSSPSISESVMKRLFWPRALALRLLIACVALAALGAGCVSLESRERELTFRPSHQDAVWFGGMPAGVRELDLPVGAAPDVQQMHAWWWPAADADAPAVLYLHGARWNLTGQLRRIEQLHRFGFSVFAIDYRGFGKSEGDLPSEETVYADALAGWQWLAGAVPDAARRFIYGHSLGGAVAIDLAARLADQDAQAGGLIVESTFTSLPDIAAAVTFEWLPTRLLLSQKFDSIDKIRRVRMPVIIAHGGSDRMVPPRFSKALYEAAREPKSLLVVDGATHNNTMIVGEDDYRAAIAKLFDLPAHAAAATKTHSVAARPGS
jgi:fermentation-respiration switch protein FrsA (DUF1100 family)